MCFWECQRRRTLILRRRISWKALRKQSTIRKRYSKLGNKNGIDIKLRKYILARWFWRRMSVVLVADARALIGLLLDRQL